VRAVCFRAGRHWDAALLDRDGTIIEDRHYLADPEGVALLPGAAEGLRLLGGSGVKRVVLTNQSGVAAGRIPADLLPVIHRRMTERLHAEGAGIERVYTCPHSPEEGCACRKPGTALAFEAVRELRLDLGRGFMVGDKDADIELARRLEMPAFLVTSGEGLATLARRKAIPDFLVDGLDAVARIVLHPGGLPVKAPLPARARKSL
jgi:histidinol-phosphate phosphatase family protein